MLSIIFLWILPALYAVGRIVRELSREGRVNNEDRVAIFLCLFPLLSLIAVAALTLIDICILIDKVRRKVVDSPRYITWSIQRKIRKRRRGPLVVLVEYLHYRRKEKGKENENILPEG